MLSNTIQPPLYLKGRRNDSERKSEEGDKEHKVTRANRPPAVPFEAICSANVQKNQMDTHDNIALLTRGWGVFVSVCFVPLRLQLT